MGKTWCHAGVHAKFSGPLHCIIRQWRGIERWIDTHAIDTDTSVHRTSNHPMLPLSRLLTARREPIHVDHVLGDWQAITIKFSGEVLPRERTGTFKGAMFAAYPGDLVFSKIDVRHGAIGLIPDDIPKAVITSEYPVFIPRPEKLRADWLHHLLRADHFKSDLQAKASGTSGRKRVTAKDFLRLQIPVPSLHAQAAIIATYTQALNQANQLVQDADAIARTSWHAFESALGIAAPPPLPDRPVYIARFKDVERWSQQSILRASIPLPDQQSPWPWVRLGDVVRDIENGVSLKCKPHPARDGKWGILKQGAVSFGTFDPAQNKELPEHLTPQQTHEVAAGDVLISSANVTRYVGACAYVEQTPPKRLLNGKIYRVRFQANNQLLPRFLADVMKSYVVREYIESNLSGTSPTMKNITKPALLNTRFPLPDLATQQRMVTALQTARNLAAKKRQQAKSMRQAARAAFESAVFNT